jgi:hypothetical protein
VTGAFDVVCAVPGRGWFGRGSRPWLRHCKDQWLFWLHLQIQCLIVRSSGQRARQQAMLTTMLEWMDIGGARLCIGAGRSTGTSVFERVNRRFKRSTSLDIARDSACGADIAPEKGCEFCDAAGLPANRQGEPRCDAILSQSFGWR